MDKKNYYKRLAKEKLTGKKVVLFGAGAVAIEFFSEYKDELNIVRVVSNIRSEWGEKRFEKKLDISKFSMDSLSQDEYLVICGPYAFEQIEVQLETLGLHMFADYVDSRMVPIVLKNKKMALFRGSCILRDIFTEIIKDEEFNEIYEAVYTMDNYTAHKFDKRFVYYCTLICDLYLYSYRILQQEMAHVISRDELPDDCVILSVSNISFGGFWPQTEVEVGEYNENLLIPYDVRRTGEYYHMTYTDNDRNINKLMEEGHGWEEIYSIISREDFYSEKEVKKVFRVGMKSLEVAGKFADIEIGDYISSNCLNVRFFQDTIHINKFVIAEYKRKIYERLGIIYYSYEEYKKKGLEYVHHGGDRPIYPAVYKRLGLKWVNDDFEYEIMTYYGVVKMNFKEYVKHYVEYANASMKARKLWDL